MKKLLLSAFIILVVQTLVYPQTNYTALKGPYGGGFEDLETSNSRLVALVRGQGIIISEGGDANTTSGIKNPPFPSAN